MGDATATSWEGELFAGVLRTRNFSARLTATEDELVLTGPMNLRYVLSPRQVEEARVAVAKFLWWSWDLKDTIAIVHEADRHVDRNHTGRCPERAKQVIEPPNLDQAYVGEVA